MEKRLKEFIPNIKDYYKINSNGEIYSDNSGKMKIRNKGTTDYQIINFSMEDGTKKTFRVHRLVMMAFNPVENMEELQVNHIDGNKRNNKLENLEWCSASENQLHAFKMGLSKPRRGSASNFAKLTEQDVQRVFELDLKGYSQSEIAEQIGCTRSNISCILRKKTWQIESSTTISKESRE